MVKPSDKKKAIKYLKEKYNAGVGRLCKLCCVSRSSYYYESKLDDREVEIKLLEMATKHPTRGFDNYYSRIRKQDYMG